MNVTEWLRDLGLQQYAAAFQDNEIDERVLPSLTADDLRELGVTLIGHRRRLLDAIAALREAGQAPAIADPPAAPPQPPAGAAEAERRQLTVMFCDVVGSTALSTQFDPEDLRELIGGYHRAVADAVARFDGFVAKYMGDGVLAYFGYPRAHEDDAERAVRAGLATIDAVSKLQGPVPLRVRIGIATGLAVVGDLTGTGAAQERGVVGETPNLAARMQSLAEPNAVVIADATHRQLGRLFDLRDLGATALAGFAEPQHAWRVLRPAAVDSRFEAFRGAAPLSPLVGREDDLDTLRRRWDRAAAGQGQLVLLSGEPGIGKSRLTAALIESLAATPHTHLHYFCAPHLAESAFHPFIAQLERAAGFDRTDTPASRLDKLDALLSATPPEERGLIADFLSVPADGRHPTLDLSPQRRRQRLLDTLLAQLVALAATHPVLMIFEDAHWADPSSRELLDHAVARLRTLPLLLIITFRPEFAPPWTGQSQVTSIILSRLSAAEAAALAQRIAGSALPAALAAEIAERADGVPLFVEELAKATLETGGNAAERQLAAVPGAAGAVPATLYASLMARLDRLQPGKDIAQTGAAIGREFSYDLLAAVADRPEPDLRRALDQLTAAGLIFARGMPPNATYLFKHALVQDVAYGTLLRSRRQNLHARIAAALEALDPDIAETQPELLAHHFAQAGRPEPAARHWLYAGRRAAAACAHDEADAHLQLAMATTAGLPDGPDKRLMELDVQVIRVGVMQTRHGYGAALLSDAIDRLVVLLHGIDDPARIATMLYQAWVFRQSRSEHRAAFAMAEEIRDVLERSARPYFAMVARMAMGVTHIYLGQQPDAHRELRIVEQRFLALPPEEALAVTDAHGPHPAVCAYGYDAWSLAILGHASQARAASEMARDIAERARHPFTTGRERYWSAGALAMLRLWPQVEATASQAVEVAAERDIAQTVAGAGAMQCLAHAMLHSDPGTADAARNAIEQLKRIILTQCGLSFLLGLLAETYLSCGLPDAAATALDEADAFVAATDERMVEADLHRIRGDLAALSPHADPEPHYLSALAIARAQQAKLFELRAACALARHWHSRGRTPEAHALLAPIHAGFTEGYDTPDLIAARTLLDTLAAA